MIPDVPEQKHVVIVGNTLLGVSRYYGVSMQNIIDWNDLEDTNIKIDQVLKVYSTITPEGSEISTTPTIEPEEEEVEITDSAGMEGEEIIEEPKPEPSDVENPMENSEDASVSAVSDIQSSIPPVEVSEDETGIVAADLLPLIPAKKEAAPENIIADELEGEEEVTPLAVLSTPVVVAPPNTTRREYQPVAPESIGKIAESFGVTEADIRVWNNIAADVTMTDNTVVIYLPVAEEAAMDRPVPEISSALDGNYTSHLIEPGDTLRSIAGRYGTTTAVLIEINQIANPDIVVLGTKLKVPAIN
ncbi:MAG: LysM peptidoglycan-binding domain-containing protein [Candidatus Hydrogenedentes bacterium]|nr:LysM peptidoglycan-binding domain-containing protein [Candidatus Hydrogenedentota bacterium]